MLCSGVWWARWGDFLKSGKSSDRAMMMMTERASAHAVWILGRVFSGSASKETPYTFDISSFEGSRCVEAQPAYFTRVSAAMMISPLSAEPTP